LQVAVDQGKAEVQPNIDVGKQVNTNTQHTKLLRVTDNESTYGNHVHVQSFSLG